MPMSRPLKNAMRSAIKPATVSNNMGKSLGPANVGDSAGGGSKDKQYKHTGKKYSGPNYPQADKTVVKGNGLK